MHVAPQFLRHWLAAPLLALGMAAGATHAHTYAPPHVQGGLAQLDVFDRADGMALPVYGKDGRNYVVGTPGHEYALRIRNTTGGRILVVTSVDGVNVVSGDTAAPGQSGYVLSPWSSVEIAGWRKSLDRTAAFFFTEHDNSYAARTGRPHNVGVIGVAIFQEKVRPIAWQPFERQRIATEQAPSAAPAPSSESRADAAAAASGAMREERAVDDMAASPSRDAAKTLSSRLGTGHGRSEHSRVSVVRFERATESPAETLSVQYDRRENLVALGVLPSPRVARHSPDPFPGTLRFAPDPMR
ncbi:MAG: hypothetical protein ACR2HE_09185 [Casimicrobiaceae bacterium]